MTERPSEPDGPAPATGPDPVDGRTDGPASDAQWEAFQREAEESVHRPSKAGPVPKEPSARARMVAARLREQDEAVAREAPRRWGRKKKEPAQWQPEGWRTGPAWQEMQGGRRGDWSRSRRTGTVFAVLTVLVGGLWFADHRGYLHLGAGGGPGSGGGTTPLAAETTVPTSAPPDQVLADLPTLERPWAGSPARRWSAGADAIDPPRAKPTGKVSAERIAQALKNTKKFLVAANLDRDVLHGGMPERALRLIDPLQKDYVREIRDALSNPTEKNDGSSLFTRFDGEEVRLVGDTVKVRGHMKVEEGDGGRALVRADYSFVYALRHADGREGVTRAVIRRVLTVEVVPEGWQSTQGTVWIRAVAGEWAGLTCEWEADGLAHPSFPSERQRTEPDGPTMDPYDRSREPGNSDSAQTCGTATRV